MKNNRSLLASIALFREVYQSEKDIFTILSIFLDDIIWEEKLYDFSLDEITTLLYQNNGFKIPHSVVKTSLKKLDYLTKTNNVQYTVVISKFHSDKKSQCRITDAVKNIELDHQNIVNGLVEYIEIKTKSTIKETEISEIYDSLCCFILEDVTNGRYLEFITSYIIENKKDERFVKKFNSLKEGVILYSGITYSRNLNEVTVWNSKLNIILDTEILFHIAGLNGGLYKKIALDFLAYVDEINRNSSQKTIYLKFLPATDIEVKNFFTSAIHILNGQGVLDPGNTAMNLILKGCSEPSDVIMKRADFYSLLSENHIELDSYEDYFIKDNHKYNIMSEEVVRSLKSQFGEKIDTNLKHLNYIAIRRGETKSCNFENTNCILVTGKSMTLQLAWCDLIKENGNVPLATHLDFIIQRLWFKLGKGFSIEKSPYSFDMITRSQITLSGIINDKLSENYTKLVSEVKSGKLSQKKAQARLLHLRENTLTPEELYGDNLESAMAFISDDNIDKFYQEYSFYKGQAEEQNFKNEKLVGELEKEKIAKEKLREENRIIVKKITQSNMKIIKEKKKRLCSMDSQKIIIDKEITRSIRLFKAGLCFFVLAFCFSIFKFFDLESSISIVTVFAILFSGFYIVAKEKNPITRKDILILLLQVYRKRVTAKIYRKYTFNEKEYMNLKNEINKNIA